MNNNSSGISCVIGCWLAALVAGIILSALAMVLGGFAFTPAAFFGLLLFVLLGAFLSYAMCSGEATKHGEGTVIGAGAASAAVATGAVASGSASSGSAAASANSDAVATSGSASTEAAVASGSTAAGLANIKSGTTLSGEDELAGRKGDWKYEAEKPAAKPKKAAAKKPAAAKPAKAAPKKAAAKPVKAPAKKVAAKAEAKPVAKDGKPELLKKARAGGPDDLKQIKGVGPKMEGMLHTMGVFHFDQVSSWRKAEVQWVDDNLDGFKGRVSRDEWVKQAKILAKGGATEFSKKVDKGGVY